MNYPPAFEAPTLKYHMLHPGALQSKSDDSAQLGKGWSSIILPSARMTDCGNASKLHVRFARFLEDNPLSS